MSSSCDCCQRQPNIDPPGARTQAAPGGQCSVSIDTAFRFSSHTSEEFYFGRTYGATDTVSFPELSNRLAAGMSAIDAEVVDLFAGRLPCGRYVPLL
jgi:hypothetical protein